MSLTLAQRLTSQELVDILVDVSLATIGRKTKSKNVFITKNSEEMRHTTESPFLEMLFTKFPDKERRKILVSHFMEFKEMSLFKIFSIVLDGKKILLRNVCYALYEKLSEGLSCVERDQKSKYQELLNKCFDEAFDSTRDVKDAIKQSFWTALTQKYPTLFTSHDSLGFFQNQFLSCIFLDNYKIIENAVNDCIK